MDKKYCISIDMDWAPDVVIDYALELLAEHNVTATLFMTNKTRCDLGEHEVAIHPNFTSLDLEKHISERLCEFPQAKGTRSHSLFFTERLRPLYAKYQINYQSNAMMHMQKGIKPFLMAPSVVEIPFYLMDTFYIIMNNSSATFIAEKLNLESDGLKVFDFHPVHIYLNTDTISRYEAVKQDYHNPKELLKARNVTKRGIKDLFVDVLEACKLQPHRTAKLIEISNEFMPRG